MNSEAFELTCKRAKGSNITYDKNISTIVYVVENESSSSTSQQRAWPSSCPKRDIDDYSSSLYELYYSSNSYSYNIEIEKDIFSNLPRKLFTESYNKQIATILKALRREYTERIRVEPTSFIRHKFFYQMDEDGSEKIQMFSAWDSGSALLYFSFEPEESESSFGLIWNDSEKKNYESRSGNIMLNDCNEIIHETLDFLFRVLR